MEQHIQLFGQLMRRHDYLLHIACQQFGVYRGQHHILRILVKESGLTQNELAQKINVAKASMTTSLRRMEKNQLISRQRCESDGRCNLIYITDKGVEAINNCEKEIDKIKHALFDGLDHEEILALNQIMTKMLKGLEQL